MIAVEVNEHSNEDWGSVQTGWSRKTCELVHACNVGLTVSHSEFVKALAERAQPFRAGERKAVANENCAQCCIECGELLLW